MINLELYKIFVLVANEENLTRASEKMNLTQPAVTKQIKNLEDILQVKLFIRSNHGIKLTKIGKELYDEIKESVNILINADSKYKKVRDINLGTHTTILNELFSECVSNYYKVTKNSKIKTFNFDNEEMIAKLKNRELDIVLSKKMESKLIDKNIKYVKLGMLNEVLAAGYNSKWTNKKITLEDIKKADLYMPRKTSETPRNFFNSINCNYEEFSNITHITYKTIVKIIQDNEGIGLLTKEFMKKEIRDKQIRILDTEFKIKPIEFGMYLNGSKFKELNQFVEIIKDYFLNKKP